MIDFEWKLLMFLKDFTGRQGDRYFWLENDELRETNAAEIVGFRGAIICHDFWVIRDALFDQEGQLPGAIVDLAEFRMAISGEPEDRTLRETTDITDRLGEYGPNPEVRSAYKRMFYRGIDFDGEIACEVAKALQRMFLALCQSAFLNDEFARFFTVEMPVYRLLQNTMTKGIAINAKGLSEKRREAEHDYYLHLKNYSAKHDMPLETPSSEAIAEKLYEAGFDDGSVSTRYVLEFVPHDNDFGTDTLALQDLDAARRVLSSLALSSGETRPVIDVFGSRTSRIHLRSPSLQNISKKYRSIVKAHAGSALCYVDFDQYEVGIMAALSGDDQLSKLYRTGDMYALFAENHLGIAGNRKAAKQLFLSYAYGMGRRALIDAATSLGATRDRAKTAFKAFSKYEEWKREICSKFQSESQISTVFGNHYKRDGKGQLSGKERRSAVSQVVQGTASLIFKKSLLSVSSLDDVRIVLPMHDALLFEHRKKETPSKVVAAFERVMTDELSGRVAGKASIGEFSAG